MTRLGRLCPRFGALCALSLGLLSLSVTARAQAIDMIHVFGDPSPDATGFPEAGLIQAPDGTFYGTTAGMPGLFGSTGPAQGAVFQMTAEGDVRVIFRVPPRPLGDGRTEGSFSPVVLGPDGALYGTTAMTPDATNWTNLFRRNASGTLSVVGATYGRSSGPTVGSDGWVYWLLTQTDIVNIERVNGTARENFVVGALSHITPPVGSLSRMVQGTDGDFYATTTHGGSANAGLIFKWNPSGAFAVLHEFAGGAGGAQPRSLIQARDGHFYGTTEAGGPAGAGTIFRLTSGGAFSTLHSFAGTDGRAPVAPLLEAADGALYGTAAGGGANDVGVAYRITTPGTFAVLHHFAGGETAGARPRGGLLQTADGLFYGTTREGGLNNVGTIFTMTAEGGVAVRHSFGATLDGRQPVRPLTRTSDGRLYGVTAAGGLGNVGTVYRVLPDGRTSILHHFGPGRDNGQTPAAGVIQATDGNLYGTTYFGGVYGRGTVFQLTPQGRFAILHHFYGGSGDGAHPSAALIQARDGRLYGTTTNGGTSDGGTVFRVALDGTAGILHFFSGAPDGLRPSAALVEARDGALYGTTAGGGLGAGTIFRVTASGAFEQLHGFSGDTDGGSPQESLVELSDGALYGTTSFGGSGSAGTLFRYAPGRGFSRVRAFSADTDGFQPRGLLRASDGSLYGTTRNGGRFRGGTLFRLAGNDFSIIAAFGGMMGSGPDGLVQIGDGVFWGVVTRDDYSTSPEGIFRLDRAARPLAPGLVSAAGDRGRGPVVVHWSPVPTATSYRVERRDRRGGPVTLTTHVTTVSFLDTTTALGRRYVYTVTAVGPAGAGSRSYEVALTAGTVVAGDFDGDHRADVTVFRPGGNAWYTRKSSDATMASALWGGSGDRPVPGDYDGDGALDVAVFRPADGTWYIRPAHGAPRALLWGGLDDLPVPGDYDSDGVTDLAVYRPSTGTWYLRFSRDRTLRALPFGASADRPVPGDYDGDGALDLAVFRPATGTWYVRRSSGPAVAWVFGASGDIPVPGDYDGDGTTDLAVYRSVAGIATWYVRYSSATTLPRVLVFGAPSDVPAPGDYDGDGVTDLAVFRPADGYWHLRYSRRGGVGAIQWGGADDWPILSRSPSAAASVDPLNGDRD